jgi:RNA polymerase sigma-70 factor (ECF subfamily)
MHTDEQLMAQFQSGDSAASKVALVELFERYRQPIYAFFRRRLANPARAEELAQECFVALIQNAERYEPRASFRSYLYGIAMRMTLAERRKSGREIAENEKLDARVDTATITDARDGTIWIRGALEKLSEQEREILMLREYEQLSYEEIASLLSMPINTVRSRLFRARTALKEQLKSIHV